MPETDLFPNIRLKLFMVLLVTGLLLSRDTGCHGPSKIPPLDPQHLQAVLEKSLADTGVPGAAALVINPAGDTWRGAAGFAELDIPSAPAYGASWTGAPMSTDLHTRAGSTTKSFTAALILRLWEEGRLDLEDPIDDYFPGLLPYSDVITIRQLLNMTAGIIDFTRVDAWADHWPSGIYTPESLVGAAIEAGATAFPPGEGWEYSNTNYVILGMIAEQAAGDTYARLIQQYIIEPMRLTQTRVPETGDDFIPEPRLHGYTWAFSETLEWQEYTWLEPSWIFAAGNIISTLDDLYTMFSALIEGRFLSPEAHAQMWKLIQTHNPIQYGMGVSYLCDAGLRIYGHNGGMPGYETSAYRYNGLYVIVMTNGNAHPQNPLQSHTADYIAKALAKAVFNRPAKLPGTPSAQ